MATHRLHVTRRRLRLRSILAAFSSLDRSIKALLALHLVTFTGGMSAVLYLSSGWVAGTAWLVLSLVMMLADTANRVDQYAKARELKANEAAMMSRLAEHPGGAPLVMDAHTHCGCTFRYAYDEVKGEWQQVEVVELNKFCPLVEAYDTRGAYP